jgi:RNA polymerase sigma factor (sigma-70 family)
LFISVKNAAIRKLKQEKRQPQFSLDELQVEFISDYGNPEELMQGSELEKELRKAIDALPPRCKVVYKLAKEDKMCYADIAALLGISIKTIDNQLSIAMKKIAETLSFITRKKN